MKALLILCLSIISVISNAQNLKFKTDVWPLIDVLDYSVASKNTLLKYHKQVVQPDGSMTDKEINVFYTRRHLARCYYFLGKEQTTIVLLDSSIYFFELANTMQIEDQSKNITAVKNLKEKISTEIKTKELEEQRKKEAEEHEQMYGEKTITAIYVGGESLGYCRFMFKDFRGNEFVFYNSSLGMFSESEQCRLKNIYAKDTFLIKYKLEKIEIYNEDIEDNEIIEKDVIFDMQFANPNRMGQVSSQLFSDCKSTIDSLSTELKKYQTYSPQFVEQQITNASSVKDMNGCQATVTSMQNALVTLKASKEKSDQIAAEQKTLTASGCNTCIITVTKKFLQACVDVDGPAIKANLTKCGYEAGASCEHIGKHKPFSYSKYMSTPNVSGAQWYLDEVDRFFVYYYSETIAAVIVRPASNTGRAKAVYVVKESGAWKVIGMDEESNRYIIDYVISAQ